MAIVKHFYNSTTRKYVALFGTLFNQIKIKRTTSSAGIDPVTQDIIVPLAYAPFQKILARVAQDPDLLNSRKPAIQLPRMSFEITNMVYDSTRKISTTQKFMKNSAENSNGQRGVIYSGVPYNLDFSLYIMTKYSEDATKVLEQIIPFFTPDWTVSARMLDDIDPIDIPIILNGVSVEELYEGDFTERQTVLHTLNFTLKGWYFGPEKEKKVIKFVETNIATTTNTDGAFQESVKVYPGLDINGNPITSIGSGASAIAQIQNGAVFKITTPDDGEGYDPDNPPAITVSSPNVIQATATAEIQGTVISGITVNESGGYYTSVPDITISAPNAPAQLATATATVNNNAISEITVTEGGRYYTANTTVVISPPASQSDEFKFGDDALQHDEFTSQTELEDPYSDIVTDPSQGFRASFWIWPTELPGGQNLSILWGSRFKFHMNATSGRMEYTFAGTSTSNARLLNVGEWNHVEFEHVGNSCRFGVNGEFGNTTSPGQGAICRTGDVIFVGDAEAANSVADYADRSFKGYIDNIAISGITGFSHGSNTSYVVPTTPATGDKLLYNFDKDVATATANVQNGEVVSIDITNDGFNYANTNPVVTISAADGTANTYQAEASAVVTNGEVTAITVSEAGKFYISANVAIEAPESNTATATANVESNGDIGSIIINNGGAGYRSIPTVTIAAPANTSIPYQDIEYDDDWGVITVIGEYED